MAALLGGSLTIRTIVSADIFDAKTDVTHQDKEASDDNGENNGSSPVTLAPTCVGKYEVATSTTEMIILFNHSEDIKVGYFEKK